MGKHIVAAVLAAIGALALAAAIMSWGSCWGAATSDACLAASDANAGMRTAAIFWVAAVLVCGFGLFSSAARVGSAIGIGVLLLVNPLTDPGFIWAFDSADSTPGRGIIGALAILGAALSVALSRRASARSQVRAPLAEAV